MIKKTYCNSMIFILTLLTVNVFGQGDEQAVKQVIDQLFKGMKTADTAVIRSTFYETPILQTVLVDKEGHTRVVTEPLDSFLLAVSTPHTEVYDERVVFDMVKVDGDLAMVWAPYQFYLGNIFSHCGVDTFQLVRWEGRWKILYLADTRRRLNCP